MDLDVLKLKAQEYQRLRNELIHEIQQLVSKAKIISEIIYSVTYTDEDIAEQTDFSMDDLIQRLGFVEEDMGYDLDNYIDDVHELIIQINMIEAMLAERAR